MVELRGREVPLSASRKPGETHARRTALGRVGGLAVALALAACSGQSPTSAPSQGAVATPPPTVAPTATSKPAPTAIPGCLPQCVTGRLTRPNALSGDYTTRNFFGGQFTVTVPDGWWGYEDSTSELAIGPRGSEDARLEFWIDIYPAKDVAGHRDEAYERSADGVKAFFLAQQGIDILHQGSASLGDLPGEAFEYRRAADAINQDPECPMEIRPCIVEFGYPEWDGAFSEGNPFHSRFVIAKATWGGVSHAVYAMFWADGESFFEADAAKAQAIVEGARLPAGVEPDS